MIALTAVLAVPALAFGVATACGSSSSAPGFPGNAGGGGGSGGSSGTGGSGASGSSGSSGSTSTFGRDGGAACSPAAFDLAGCACQSGQAPRGCYSGPPPTRGYGACHGGTQSCVGNEIRVWGPCQNQVLPDPCADGGCEGPNFCSPPVDAAPPPAKDAGLPPLPPNCHYILGGLSGFFDGGYYCEATMPPPGGSLTGG